MRCSVAALFLCLLCGNAAAAEIMAGVASVYRPGSYRWGGPKAANGERIDFKANTVAHPQAARSGPMPFGSCLKIALGKREQIARVNDNGPHIKNRKLDLTPGLANRLGCDGLCRVSFWRVACS